MKFFPRILDLSTRAVLTALVAALLTVGSGRGVSGTALVLVAVVIAAGIGWPWLLQLPAKVGSGLVISIAGIGSLAVVYGASREPWIRSVPLVFAFAVVLAFINELTRPDDRARLTESLLGTISGVVIVVGASGWLAADMSTVGHRVVLVAAVAIAAAAVVAALPVYGWTSFSTTTLGGVAAAVLIAQTAVDLRMLTAVAVGTVTGLMVATTQMIFVRISTLRSARAALATVVVPIAVAGPFIYAIARLTLNV